MTVPAGYRSVAGLNVPLPLVPRIVAAIYDRYPEATAGITDPDAAVRAALRAWVVETLADFEEQQAKAAMEITVAQTIAGFEQQATTARGQALTDAEAITEIETPAEPV